MKYGKTKDRISNLIIFLTLIITVLTVFQIIYIFNYINLEVKDYKKTQLTIENMEYTLTKKEIRNIIKELYDIPHIYIETDNLPEKENGISYVLLRMINVKKSLDIKTYAITYAHELTHIKYQTADETFTTFMTFVTLYESGNKELQNMALKEAQGIINGGYAGTEYDCGYYILKYLKNI